MAYTDSARFFCVFLLFVSIASAPATGGPVTGRKVFDVRSYGARGDGSTDNANAFSKAWNDACQSRGKSRVYIPVGTYLLGAVTFEGPCKGSISFVIKGTLLAPKNADHIKQDTWIIFKYVNYLAVNGGGTLDGQGAYSWPLNDCRRNNNCRGLPMNIGFQFVNHSRVRRIRSINSKMGHFNFFSCSYFNVTGVTITAPDDSPNTDGIKIGFSDHMRINDVNISTGDDCIALLSGNTDIEISNVNCGPGHGISVGSLGKYRNEKNVEGLIVRNCTFRGTSDGVRIKTWASSLSQIVVSKFLYEDIHMINVGNPIIIDQQYCPHPPCERKSDSHVQIQDVTYKNIWGTSTNKVAVNLQCSKSFPCKDIELRDIQLVHPGGDGRSAASCAYVDGSSYGKQIPPTCVH